MTTLEEQAKRLQQKINDLAEERDDYIRGVIGEMGGNPFTVPGVSGKFDEYNAKIMEATENLNAVERRINAPRVAAEDAAITAAREAFPLH